MQLLFRAKLTDIISPPRSTSAVQRSTDSYMVLHADLFVKEMKTSLDFYRDKLGFCVVDDTILQGPLAASLSDGLFNAVRLVLLRVSRTGALIELQEYQQESALTSEADNYTPPPSLVTILVSDLATHIEQTKRKGLEPSSQVYSVHLPRQGSCNVIFYKDPDGNRLEFLQTTQHPRQA